MLFIQEKDMLNDVVKTNRLQIHIRSLVTNKPQQISRDEVQELWFSKAVFTKQPVLIAPQIPKTGSTSRWSSETVLASPFPLSASFLVTELSRSRAIGGLSPGLTCSLFQFCSRITAEPIYWAPCSLQTAVFSCKSAYWWNLFSGYCSRQLFL